MSMQKVIEQTREPESEFFVRLAEYLNSKSVFVSHLEEPRAAKAYRDAAERAAEAAKILLAQGL